MAKRTTSRVKSPRDVFDLDRLTEIVELMKDHGLTEVDLEQDKQKIRISRGGTSPAALPMAPVAPPAPSADAAADPPPVAASDSLVTINSPMVGTFYSKPNPETPAFVKVGDHVGPDTIVCLIEAMKVFNEIPSEVSGKIAAVLVENEASVEFGAPLFKIDTSQ